MILENFEELNSSQKNLFSRTCLRLLSTGFLARDKKDNKEMYYFLLSHKKYFDEYFEIIDYEILLDRENGAVQLTHKENSNLMKLKKDETIILLILRILYHQHLADTSVNDNIVVRIDELHQYYDSLELKKKINKTDLVTILRLYKKFNIIEPVGDITKSGSSIIIFPTILMAINTTAINDVYDLISRIEVKPGGETDEETD
ncbi:MAG: DUF4194 domain-containing protein [Bacilli bacterium]|nr:DUF4194 domain-containing protein [Bacilli bacterium]MBN2877921.1 DUF4194 domain-containing protein [Bacilli bacterium]